MPLSSEAVVVRRSVLFTQLQHHTFSDPIPITSNIIIAICMAWHTKPKRTMGIRDGDGYDYIFLILFTRCAAYFGKKLLFDLWSKG